MNHTVLNHLVVTFAPRKFVFILISSRLILPTSLVISVQTCQINTDLFRPTQLATNTKPSQCNVSIDYNSHVSCDYRSHHVINVSL